MSIPTFCYTSALIIFIIQLNGVLSGITDIKPRIEPNKTVTHRGQHVTLTCKLPDSFVAPPSGNAYIWNKVDSKKKGFSQVHVKDTLSFRMDATWAGNWTCAVANSYGWSLTSDPAEIVYGPYNGSRLELKWLAVSLFCVYAVFIIIGALLLILYQKRYRQKVEQYEAAVRRTRAFMEADYERCYAEVESQGSRYDRIRPPSSYLHPIYNYLNKFRISKKSKVNTIT